MWSYNYLLLTGIVFSSSLGLSFGQGNITANGCYQNSAVKWFHEALQHPNASASYKLPSFTPPGNTSLPPGDWTWNTTVTVLNNTITQSFSIDTPTLKDVDNENIPYELCAMAFYDLPRETSLQGQNDNGDCKSTLSQDCVDAVVQSANSTAASFTTAAGSSDDVSDLCGDMLRQFSMKIPNECQQMSENGAWLGGSAGLFGSSDSGSSPDENSTECNSVETKQNTVHQLFGFDYGDSSTFNETAYDDSVYRVVPFLTSAWLKRTTSGGPAWSDTRLVCMRAKNIQAGSRAPPPPPTTGLATRGRFLSLKNLVSFGCVAILLGLTL